MLRRVDQYDKFHVLLSDLAEYRDLSPKAIADQLAGSATATEVRAWMRGRRPGQNHEGVRYDTKLLSILNVAKLDPSYLQTWNRLYIEAGERSSKSLIDRGSTVTEAVTVDEEVRPDLYLRWGAFLAIVRPKDAGLSTLSSYGLSHDEVSRLSDFLFGQAPTSARMLSALAAVIEEGVVDMQRSKGGSIRHARFDAMSLVEKDFLEFAKLLVEAVDTAQRATTLKGLHDWLMKELWPFSPSNPEKPIRIERIANTKAFAGMVWAGVRVHFFPGDEVIIEVPTIAHGVAHVHEIRDMAGCSDRFIWEIPWKESAMCFPKAVPLGAEGEYNALTDKPVRILNYIGDWRIIVTMVAEGAPHNPSVFDTPSSYVRHLSVMRQALKEGGRSRILGFAEGRYMVRT